MANANPLLQTRDLQTGYRSGRKKIIVADRLPELELKPGQLICLLGPNGSGKSTLLRTLAGLQPALGGSVHIEGVGQWNPEQLARKVSLVLTDRVRGANLTVYSLIALGRYPYSGWLGQLSATDTAAIEEAIRAAGIGELRDRKAHTLSDGENQKVMLARALAQDTPILMLDEPTAHLDLPSRIRLMRLLHQLAVQTRKGILLSTHELELALQVADEVWLLQSGGALYRGAPEDLVLNGVFEAVFAREEVVFDKEAGSFLIHSSHGRPVRLTGEGTAGFWTRRALRRAGYVLASPQSEGEAVCHIRISTRSGPEGGASRTIWLVEGSGRTGEYESIGKLLQAITGN